MKVAVRLAILVAAILLVTNMAFADACDKELCYDIVMTYENGDTYNDYWEMCLNNDGTGFLNDEGGQYFLRLFGGGPGWFNTSGSPAIGGNPQWSTWILSGEYDAGFLQPIGDGYMLTGEGVSYGDRYTALGKKVPCMIDY